MAGLDEVLVNADDDDFEMDAGDGKPPCVGSVVLPSLVQTWKVSSRESLGKRGEGLKVRHGGGHYLETPPYSMHV